MRIMIRKGGKGSGSTQSAASIGVFVTTRKCPRMVEPAISIRTMQAVRSDSATDLINPSKLMSLLTTDKRRTANVPALPASVGVKKPHDIPPVTMMKIRITHITSLSDTHLSFHDDFSPLGPNNGSILHHPYMMKINNKETISPGTGAARNNLPMDVSVIIPNTIRVTLGGMRLPRVPETAMIPVESFLL